MNTQRALITLAFLLPPLGCNGLQGMCEHVGPDAAPADSTQRTAAAAAALGDPADPADPAAPAAPSDPAASGDSLPATPYLLPETGHGLLQSPINIVTAAVGTNEHHHVKLHYRKSKEKIVNLGHTVQVNYDDGSSIEFDGKTYDFKQFHFHTPAEHLIDGVTYPLEMHMVHTLESDPNTYLVVGVLFKEGETNAFINEFVSKIPRHEGEKIQDAHKIDVSEVFPAKSRYYHYQGSLTTPPYTESVTWVVLEKIHEASPEQIETFNALEGNNARHIQALYARHVDAD